MNTSRHCHRRSHADDRRRGFLGIDRLAYQSGVVMETVGVGSDAWSQRRVLSRSGLIGRSEFGKGVVDLVDSGDDAGMAGEANSPGSVGRFELGRFVLKLAALGGQALDVALQGVLPGGVGVGECGGGGLLGVAGSAAGERSEVGV
jgi:hypothetical protein